MKGVFYIVTMTMLIIIESVNGQNNFPYKSGFDDCTGKVVWVTKAWKKFPEIDYDRFLSSYLNKTSSNGLPYRYNDTSTLIQFKREISFSNFISFVSEVNFKNIRLNVYLSKKRYQVDNTLYDVTEMVMKDTQYWTSYPMELKKAIGHDFFGLPPEDSIIDISFIDSIKVFTGNSFFLIEDPILGKLCNPNISDYYGSYKPIEVYYSPIKDRIYIYVMGQIYAQNLDWNGKDKFEPDLYENLNSYVSKIIINPKDISDVKNITIPGFYLWSYGWPRCKDFWPF